MKTKTKTLTERIKASTKLERLLFACICYVLVWEVIFKIMEL